MASKPKTFNIKTHEVDPYSGKDLLPAPTNRKPCWALRRVKTSVSPRFDWGVQWWTGKAWGTPHLLFNDEERARKELRDLTKKK